jgi:hypothetical protein
VYSKRVVFVRKDCTANELKSAVKSCLKESVSEQQATLNFKKHVTYLVRLLRTPSLELFYKNSRNFIVRQTGTGVSIEKREWQSRYGHVPVEKVKLSATENIGTRILNLLA